MNLLASIIVVTNIGFTAAYDTDIHNPRWVAYDLHPSMIVQGERRPYSFKADPKIGNISNGEHFYKACHLPFDRGHLCPSADMCWNTNAQRQTFYFSNVCPQYQRVNRGVWRETEEEVRRLATSGTVHVVIVPLDFVYTESIGEEWTFPKRFVKIAYGYFGVRFYDVRNDQ